MSTDRIFDYDKYEAVIGLEVHAQMLTKSKAFCSDSTEYGASPNSQVSPISLGHPGTLPVHNKEAVKYAIRVGVACGCDITSFNYYARKNYFYADLPKGYQITQDKTPICTGGKISIKLKDGSERDIRLQRIHMEEDSGKSMHDQDVYDSLIDLNRAGVPLVEMVSEPDIKTGEEAYQYLTEVRRLVRYLDICDGNMEEGSLRCDANISVNLKGAKEYGTRVEVKNMNSIRNVQRAIDFEIKRQIEALESGEKLYKETRTFEAMKGITIVMRSKEDATDYRYFPEPDLPPLHITSEFIAQVKSQMPALPKELFEKFTKVYGLNEYDSNVLTENKDVAEYFEGVLKHTSNIKAAANWVMVSVKGYLNEQAIEIKDFVLQPAKIAEIIDLIDSGKVSNSVASQKVFPAMITEHHKSALEIAEGLNLIQESDSDALVVFIQQAVAMYPDKVTEYKAGKKSLVGLFMGEVMKLSKGKADPKLANQLLRDELEK
ncbi:MAG: Asp-tRNA(Asn)/Glu-tRNA(Gln) amidotransferase subunit GatB [Bacteroidia bacterium]|jgi:aspartyl-tRNA(Asn)/glutamyl-tRNA(Gln) amidotransferase subunit B|nr:Asp-tRNA(Asn)/Glu-tRNA(Gln) amidotransferase subunit GatB [Bacteroidia bacterium]MBP7261184.1 Asp-tRNA(Asn)/Glu-tRNA(Gln) amidotransferase subunit GatB [Bacteroidia bacterium]MBP9180062.1 Asp-tRNA(Asn)/Glu-tRNA(Gln) amidotransferase subunit GatB [Bacteroidia bacterium]MBP9725198.1 Asp-tRNA(Asn)/Glu-tRNA(Gln) amidotransferase subunit GatB [Bacteroidia bacterium]